MQALTNRSLCLYIALPQLCYYTCYLHYRKAVSRLLTGATLEQLLDSDPMDVVNLSDSPVPTTGSKRQRSDSQVCF
jgi:hypothetical protein